MLLPLGKIVSLCIFLDYISMQQQYLNCITACVLFRLYVFPCSSNISELTVSEPNEVTDPRVSLFQRFGHSKTMSVLRRTCDSMSYASRRLYYSLLGLKDSIIQQFSKHFEDISLTPALKKRVLQYTRL